MKKSTLATLSAFTAIMLLTSGCETLSDTFGLGHQCDKNCFPICQYQKEKSLAKNEEDWKAFKEYKPFVYKPTGKEFLDVNVQMFEKLSNQLYTEVVIPYIESDNDGSLAVYKAFKEQVDFEMQAKNIDRKEATKAVLEVVKKENPAEYEKLVKSFKLIENRDFSNQTVKYINSILPQLTKLVIVLTVDAKGQKNITYFDLAYVGVQVIPEINKAIDACQFLLETMEDKDRENAETAEFMKEFDSIGSDSQQ